MLRNPSQTNQFGNQLGFLRLKERARRLAHPPAEELVRQSTSNLFNKGLIGLQQKLIGQAASLVQPSQQVSTTNTNDHTSSLCRKVNVSMLFKKN